MLLNAHCILYVVSVQPENKKNATTAVNTFFIWRVVTGSCDTLNRTSTERALPEVHGVASLSAAASITQTLHNRDMRLGTRTSSESSGRNRRAAHCYIGKICCLLPLVKADRAAPPAAISSRAPLPPGVAQRVRGIAQAVTVRIETVLRIWQHDKICLIL